MKHARCCSSKARRPSPSEPPRHTRAIETWGPIDILVNTASILRDKSFAKMALEDFRRVIEVHVMGAVNATKSVWAQMQAQQHGRIVVTTSSSGL